MCDIVLYASVLLRSEIQCRLCVKGQHVLWCMPRLCQHVMWANVLYYTFVLVSTGLCSHQPEAGSAVPEASTSGERGAGVWT